ncbi:MAG: GFA family protein [Pacificimonas sp.]
MAEGGCHCGEVRYRFTGEPVASAICNCPTCRRASGAQNVAYVMVSEGAFRWLKGAPATYASSRGVTRSFCGTCGTSLAFEADFLENMIDLTTASLDDAEAFPPTMQINDTHALGWTRTQDGLPRMAGFPE